MGNWTSATSAQARWVKTLDWPSDKFSDKDGIAFPLSLTFSADGRLLGGSQAKQAAFRIRRSGTKNDRPKIISQERTKLHTLWVAFSRQRQTAGVSLDRQGDDHALGPGERHEKRGHRVAIDHDGGRRALTGTTGLDRLSLHQPCGQQIGHHRLGQRQEVGTQSHAVIPGCGEQDAGPFGQGTGNSSPLPTARTSL